MILLFWKATSCWISWKQQIINPFIYSQSFCWCWFSNRVTSSSFIIRLLPAQSLNPVQLFVTPWTVAHQVPLSVGFSRQEYWSGLPFPSPGDLPHPGIEPRSPALQADSFSSETPGKHKNTAVPFCRGSSPPGDAPRCPHCRWLLHHQSHQVTMISYYFHSSLRLY